LPCAERDPKKAIGAHLAATLAAAASICLPAHPSAKHRRRTLSDQVAMRARLEVPDTVVSIGAAD
jgi:hypothetical protein